MARHGTPIHVRVTDDERATIEKKAATFGLKLSEYVRRAALGDLAQTSPPPATPGSTPPQAARPAVPGPASEPSSGGLEGKEPQGSPGPVDGLRAGPDLEPAGSIPAPGATSVADEPFLVRRTRQLVGQGKTTKVARSLAEAEWRSRGNEDPSAV